MATRMVVTGRVQSSALSTRGVSAGSGATRGGGGGADATRSGGGRGGGTRGAGGGTLAVRSEDGEGARGAGGGAEGTRGAGGGSETTGVGADDGARERVVAGGEERVGRGGAADGRATSGRTSMGRGGAGGSVAAAGRGVGVRTDVRSLPLDGGTIRAAGAGRVPFAIVFSLLIGATIVHFHSDAGWRCRVLAAISTSGSSDERAREGPAARVSSHSGRRSNIYR